MDRHTLAQDARTAADAYQLPWKDSWYELDPTWNTNAVSCPERMAATHTPSEQSAEFSLWLGQ
ncbi:hypothetical protein L210DRAFT_3561949 [Boletus edulis BED1]|uniref:Uncharacterized protein n=1 Tax=Boletus edulis BED1 TaxID=1328754 RepID=A0AAD4BGX3_BOLED|nr:hypothetical protein L210DRAFT_3561949 [Boletus edulis BED1]